MNAYISKKILLMLVAFLVTAIAFAQNDYQDVVYLKTGNIIRGLIIEQVPNVSLKIETGDGSLFVLKMSEIEKMTKERPVVPQTQNQMVTLSSKDSKEAAKSAKKEMDYFKKVMKSNNVNAREKYTGLIENEELLYEIAKKYGNTDNRTTIKAVERINDEELLYDIAMEIRPMRELAVERAARSIKSHENSLECHEKNRRSTISIWISDKRQRF